MARRGASDVRHRRPSARRDPNAERARELNRRPVVGVLALQGDVEEHVAMLAGLGARAIGVKTRSGLDAVDGLVVPGGESTTVIRLLERFELDAPIVERVRAGMPFWGTCMGMIVAASDVADLDQKTLGLLDVTVRRNAFGRQLASEEIDLDVPVLGRDPFPAIFIRAPWIERAGPRVEILASHGGHGVFVREGHVMGTSFHPELTSDPRVHAYFIEMIRDATKPSDRANSLRSPARTPEEFS